MEVCPACGDFVEALYAETGWCLECSEVSEPAKLTPCGGCRRLFKPSHETRTHCSTCLKYEWRISNADLIEAYMAQGFGLLAAIAEVRSNNAPCCLNCGTPIKSGYGGVAFFCKEPACRKVYRRYRIFKEQRRMPKEAALKEALAISH